MIGNIHDCYKKKSHNGASNFCYIYYTWYFGDTERRQQCQFFFWTTPKRFRFLLIYGGVLAALGVCRFCLGDERLPPEVRILQFSHLNSWRVHNRDSFATRERRGEFKNGAKCAHPFCHKFPSSNPLRG